MKKIFKALLVVAAASVISACGGGGEGGGTPNGPSATLRLYPPISGVTLPVGAAGSLDVEVQGGRGPYTITSSDAAVQVGLSDDNKLVVLSTSQEGSSDVVVYDSSLPVQQVKITMEAKSVPMASSVGTTLNLAPNESRQINIRGGVRPYTVSSSDASVVAASVSGAAVTVTGQAKGETATATVKVTDAVGQTLDVTVSVQVTTLAVTPSTVVGPAGSTNSLNIVGGLPPYKVNSSNTASVSASVSGSTVSFSLLAKGASTITVTDSAGKSVAATVTVNSDLLKVSPMSQSVPEKTAASVDYLIAGGTGTYTALISAADAASVTSWSITASKLTVVVPAGPCVAADKVIPIDIYDAALAKQTVTLTIKNTDPAACP